MLRFEPTAMIRVAFLFLSLSHSFCAAQDSSQSQPPAATPSPSVAPSSASTPSTAPPDSTKLEVVKSVKPVYPLEAREKALQGHVVVSLTVNENGDVEEANATGGEPMLAKAAEEAFRKWKFKPFIKNGKPVKVHTLLPFDFAFAGNVSDKPDPASKAAVQQAKNDQGTSSSGTDSSQRPMKLRVSSGVAEGNLLHRVAPVYPLEARQNRIQGTVILAATITREGRIENLHVISGEPVLARSAMDAVAQWRYKPYFLKGEPVEVETTIKVTYHM